MKKPVKLTIEGREYALYRMAPIKAIEFAPKVTSVLSGASGGLPDLLEAVRGQDKEQIGVMVLGLLSGLEPAKLTELAMEALEASDVHASGDGHVAGKLGNKTFFNDWFDHSPGDMLPVCVWAIWEQSKDFFIGAVPGFQQVMGGQVFQSQTNTPEITTSEES